MSRFSVSVIIPAYNEEAIIAVAIEAALAVLGPSMADYEIIVVNDGSSDSTRAILDSTYSQHPHITICHLPINQGFGGAIKAGIALATRECLFCVPSDSPLTVAVYEAFSSHAHLADILVSYRRQKVGYTWRGHLNSWVYHRLISTLYGMRLRDYNWIHLYHRRVFDQYGITIEYRGIFMLAEILIKAHRAGCSFYELEVEQRERLTGIATASRLAAILRTLGEVLHYRLRG